MHLKFREVWTRGTIFFRGTVIFKSYQHLNEIKVHDNLLDHQETYYSIVLVFIYCITSPVSSVLSQRDR